MSYDIVAIDMDGTLLSDQSIITKENIDAIEAANKKGVKMVICSGRGIVSLRNFAEIVGLNTKGNYIIAFNGCEVYEFDNNEPLFSVTMDKNLAIEAVGYAKNFKVHTIVYKDSANAYMDFRDKHTENYFKTTKSTALFCEDIALAIKKENKDVFKVLFLGEYDELYKMHDFIWDKLGERGNIFFTSANLLEIVSSEADKGQGLKWLCNKLNIAIDRSIAIGDNHNDISMIKAAGLGVAMKNSGHKVKQYADYITTKTNNESGVAEVLRKFVL